MKKTSMKKRICASLISLLICVSLLIGCLPAINAAPSNPFTDVKANAYYYNAVLWALNNNITTGTTSTTFSPDAPCTRGQIVTFLYRYITTKLTVISAPKIIRCHLPRKSPPLKSKFPVQTVMLM